MKFLLLSMALLSLAADPDTYRPEIERWRAQRIERLKREDSWLTLVGLFWLEEGENPIGAGAANRVMLPAGKAPDRLGSLTLVGGIVTARLDPAAGATSEGRPASTLVLKPDTSDGGPTIVRRGSLSFYVIARGKRLGVRVKDSESVARRNFHGIESYPIDPRWRIVGRFDRYPASKNIPVPNVLGEVSQEPSPGVLVFEIHGREYRLEPVLEEGESDYFVIFGDATNGRETYGGGRFLYVSPPDAAGKAVIDFNKAYNPPCVFSPYATCPLPPPQNKLPVAIEAGEKNYEH
jgi:uncharacterized protein (DUF1684 family)